MTGEERRRGIVETLRAARGPLSGAALGHACGVSRQVVVQDIALIRRSGTPVVSTSRGYVLLPGNARPRACSSATTASRRASRSSTWSSTWADASRTSS